MIIPKHKIQDFIPQRPPFIMIDNLLAAGDRYFKAGFTITPQNIFLEHDCLREFALIENIAQTASAGLAFSGHYKGKGKPEGYLGSISKLQLYQLPKVNDTIYTIVNILAQLDTMFLIKGVNYLGGETLMECELKLVGVDTHS